jgi:uncharacterized protein
MPVNPTYPGVYVEEVPSDVKTIVGVATARTAFIGRALRGPLDEPVRIKNFGDFERRFGGLWKASALGYAVRHYFLNGGSDAIIVRVSNPDAAGAVPGHAAATASLGKASEVVFEAIYGGVRGNSIQVAVRASSQPGQAADPSRFDATISGTKPNGDPEQKEYVGKTLRELKDDLAATPWHVAMPDPDPHLDANLLERATFTLAGGVDAVRASLELKAGAATVAVLRAKEPGAAGNGIVVSISDATGGDPALFDLRVQQGATDVTLADQDLAGLQAAIDADPTLQGLVELAGAPGPGRPENVAARPMSGGADAVKARAEAVAYTNPPGVLVLEAANPGAWGNQLIATVHHDGQEASQHGFNLVLKEVDERGDLVALEAHLNVSVDAGDKRRVDKVLADQSAFARLAGALPAERPPVRSNIRFAGGRDGPPIADAHLVGNEARKKGLYALENEDLFNILCVPPPTREGDVLFATWTAMARYCEKRRAILMVDPPRALNSVEQAVKSLEGKLPPGQNLSDLRHPNAVFNFPLLEMADPLQENRLEPFVPCGVVAGLYARTDAARGVWKAPAGQDASLRGVQRLTVKLTDPEHGDLNPLGLNCARTFPVTGTVMWGARTSRGADQLASEWKYVPVRRTALYIEESLFRGTQWVVFEPNDEGLWAQIRLNVGAFMHDLFRKGAFQGTSAKDAYFVKCDAETTPQSDIDKGIVNILVGFAPLKPAEFVFIKLSQIARKGGA